MSDQYYIDYYEPTPSAQPFRDSLITALCAAVEMQDGPEREYTRKQPANDAPLGADGVMPQSGMRGVNWKWHNHENHRTGRWAVRDVEHGNVRYFPGTLGGLEQAKAFATSRTLAKAGRPRAKHEPGVAPESPGVVGVTWQWQDRKKTRGSWRVYDPETRKPRMFTNDEEGLARAVAFAQSRTLTKYARGPGRKRKDAA